MANRNTTKATAPKLGPIARALLGRVDAAADVRALYALEADAWAGTDKGLAGAELAHVRATIAAARDRLAPPVRDARRLALEGFAAFWLADNDDAVPSAESMAEALAWYAAGCAPGGPGLDSHAVLSGDSALFVAAEAQSDELPFAPLHLANDLGLTRALFLMDLADDARTADDLHAASSALAGAGDMPDALRAEVEATITRNRARLDAAAGRAALARVLAAPDGFALMVELHGFDCKALVEPWRKRYHDAMGKRLEQVAPAVTAEMVRRAETAPDLGALRRVYQDAFCLELESNEVGVILAAVEAARVRLTPPDDDIDAIRRRAVESFVAVVLADKDAGFVPESKALADLVDWFIPTCRAGGPGLLVHAGSYGETTHFVPAEAPAT